MSVRSSSRISSSDYADDLLTTGMSSASVAKEPQLTYHHHVIPNTSGPGRQHHSQEP